MSSLVLGIRKGNFNLACTVGIRVTRLRPYKINLLLLGPYLPKIFQIKKKKKIHILIHVFSARPSFSAKRQ